MTLHITDIHEELPGVKTFFLERADGQPISYLAGQFLTFKVGDERRSYSFSSTPGVDAQAAITLRRVANGVLSRKLIDDAQPGDTLECVGAATGLFTLPALVSDYEAVWLFAAGIGITPIYSLLKAILHQTTLQRVVLLYSSHSPQQTVFLEELKALQVQFPKRFELVFLWSNAQDMLRARLSKVSFPVLAKSYLHEDPKRVLSYLCGPTSYMWMLQLLLQDFGLPAASVRRELFGIRKEVHHRLPADRKAHQIEVRIAGISHRFTSQYPDSILKSAQAAGITLPYSCEAGQCGSCTARCVSGKVWMSYDEVLTANDLAEGRVLTCTGHAVGGDVVLVYPE